jgi:hypothetical protein
MRFITKLAKFTLFVAIIVVLDACHREAPPSVVDENRIVEIEVKCRAFDNSTNLDFHSDNYGNHFGC